jgi:hypothetical protein
VRRTHNVELFTTNECFNLVAHLFEEIESNGRVVNGSRMPDAVHFTSDVLIAYPISVRVEGIVLQGQSSEAGWDVEYLPICRGVEGQGSPGRSAT